MSEEQEAIDHLKSEGKYYLALELAESQIESERSRSAQLEADARAWRNEQERQASFDKTWKCSHPRNLYVGFEDGTWNYCECWAEAAESSLASLRQELERAMQENAALREKLK